MIRTCLLSAVTITALFTARGAEAQTIQRITPEAASIGDTVILTGTNLQSTTAVRFFAIVGGFVGTWTVDVVPTSVTATRVTAVVPQMAGFAPDDATPPGEPVGTVSALGLGLSNTVEFFYLQATPEIETVGQGSPQPGGLGAPVIGFTIAGGPPESPNPGFVLTLENAIPNTPAILGIGLPGSEPFPVVGGGTFILDPTAPIIFVPPLVSDASGDIKVPASIPAGVTGTISLQWIELSPAPLVSNGMKIAF